jgi:AbrB family looped-hinge helix DNA binding protein
MKQKNQLAIKNKNEIMTVKVSEKGQITLPRIIQRFLEIQKGDRLVVCA